jgi:RNA-binding protein
VSGADEAAARPSALRGKHRRFLRGLGVNLDAQVFVGKDGITDAVLAEIGAIVKKRELVKVRLLDTVGGERKDVAKELAARADTELIQVLGRTVLLYRRNEEKPVIELPK